MLRTKNQELESLRAQMDRFDRHSARSLHIISTKSMPPHISKIQQISQEVYSALETCFNCADASHNEHSASLSLDVEMVGNARMNMAITCGSNCSR
jgi:hypothetical protein